MLLERHVYCNAWEEGKKMLKSQSITWGVDLSHLDALE